MDTKAKSANSFGKFSHQCSLQRTAGSDAFVNDAEGAASPHSPGHRLKYPSEISVSRSPGRWYRSRQTQAAGRSHGSVGIPQTLPCSGSRGPGTAAPMLRPCRPGSSLGWEPLLSHK